MYYSVIRSVLVSILYTECIGTCTSTYIIFVESKSNHKQVVSKRTTTFPKIVNHDYYDLIIIISLLVCTIFSIIYTYTSLGYAWLLASNASALRCNSAMI